ncbi:hypothetical protein BC834DRAFT_833036 [Gloeopeniophorella convolvens]|nr:hypothetical protein BC834DRAFT_833036 [Gloeopeniophorella convolvens]
MTGDDIPPFADLGMKRTVEMVVEESVHYHASGPGSADEWKYDTGFGSGVNRMGPNNRILVVSLDHQEHCLRRVREWISDRSGNPAYGHHLHCLGVLRQEALCHPDLTLEPGDFTKRNFEVDRVGEIHTCRDFERFFEDNMEQWLTWTAYLRRAGMPL